MKIGRSGMAGGTVLWLAVAVATADEGPDAAALVRQVRAGGVDRARSSLRYRADEHSVRSPRGIEKRTKELRAQFPGAWTFRSSATLSRKRTGGFDLAFDRSRVRLRVTTVGEDDDLRVWDGARFILANHYDYAPDRDGYLINRNPEQWLYWHIWTHFASFRAGPHSFWWNQEKDVEAITRLLGKPEDYAYGGLADFHGTSCHVVNHRASWTSLFIGAIGGRLHGIRSGAREPEESDLPAVAGQREGDAPAHRSGF